MPSLTLVNPYPARRAEDAHHLQAHVNHGDDNLTVTSLRLIKAGEEILNYYGPHPNSELLRRYGYVSPKHSRYDVVEISWDLVVDSTKHLLETSDQTWASAVCRPRETTVPL